MIDTDDLDNMSRRDLVELLEAYNESLAEVKRLQTIIHEIEHNNGVSAEVVAASGDAVFMNELLAELKQIREILEEAFSAEAKHSGAEYLNMIAKVTGLIE